MLFAVAYIVVAAALAQWIANGAPGWINVLVLLCLWNTLKFLVNGPVTVVRLLRVRAIEPQLRNDGDVPNEATLAKDPATARRS